ncbi:hypothetical protein BDV26DRAFT_254359 [Aspergillus bertholletiae]|uniref:Uncharacterized protein n=1 Tax=Aspergillus bertholletiae TaxID=1226010 RepID=A0A5N7BK11_9EURO|nr:hypothetical protein BDV26DRAFT_254359 [Aspergillus bertholletiae]
MPMHGLVLYSLFIDRSLLLIGIFIPSVKNIRLLLARAVMDWTYYDNILDRYYSSMVGKWSYFRVVITSLEEANGYIRSC